MPHTDDYATFFTKSSQLNPAQIVESNQVKLISLMGFPLYAGPPRVTPADMCFSHGSKDGTSSPQESPPAVPPYSSQGAASCPL